MKASATKERAKPSGPSQSYLKTRVRASRLLAAAHVLAIVELTRRLHQAYRFAYDKQAADWVLPQKPEPYVDQKVLNSCTEDYFGVTLNPNGFTPSSSGNVGSFTGTGPSYLATNPHGAGNNDTFTVKNNATTYDTKYLTYLDNQFRAAMGNPPNPPGVTVRGTTNRFAPLTNYTGNNLGPMQTLRTQVHELGHSLDAITGIGYDFLKDDLAGQILANCVRSRGGFKYK